MLILACDTATSILSVALCDGNRLAGEWTAESGRRHAEQLPGLIDRCLMDCGCTLNEVELLAVSIGPGSFTGLRVGVSAWKGLALALDRPLIGVPTLDAMARIAPFPDQDVCPLLDARMKEVFGAVYRFEGLSRRKLTDDLALPPDAFCALLDPARPTVFFGDGARQYRDALSKNAPHATFLDGPLWTPRASAVAEEALERSERGDSGDADQVSPVYLRKSQAEQNRERAAGAAGPAVG